MNVKIDGSKIKDTFTKSKKYLLIYLILVLLASISMIKPGNHLHIKFDILIMSIIFLLSMIFIAVYIHNNDDRQLYKTVFIVILVFGLIASFAIPINSVSDEPEHLIRAEMTSRGVLFPEQVNGSFISINSFHTFFNYNHYNTIFNATGSTDPIDYSVLKVPSAFEQNPFYGYIFSGLGILIAKLLDLNVIWIMWLGRIFNSIFYAAVISFAVKIIPKFKMIIFTVSCLPVILFQAFSTSIDSFSAALGIFLVAYFIYLCENKFGRKELIIFSIITILIGLCKLPYLGFILLLFFLPKDNFNNKNYYAYVLLAFLFTSAIGLLWSDYATTAMQHSWRSTYMLTHNVNIHEQIQFIISHPKSIIYYFSFILRSSKNVFGGVFNFFDGTGEYSGSSFLSLIITVFYFIICIFYPRDKELNLKAKLGIILTFLVVYFGIFAVQLLSWTPVGQLTIVGIHTRYFLPLFALLPFVLNVADYKNENMDRYIFVLTLVFISSMIISFIIKCY